MRRDPVERDGNGRHAAALDGRARVARVKWCIAPVASTGGGLTARRAAARLERYGEHRACIESRDDRRRQRHRRRCVRREYAERDRLRIRRNQPEPSSGPRRSAACSRAPRPFGHAASRPWRSTVRRHPFVPAWLPCSGCPRQRARRRFTHPDHVDREQPERCHARADADPAPQSQAVPPSGGGRSAAWARRRDEAQLVLDSRPGSRGRVDGRDVVRERARRRCQRSSVACNAGSRAADCSSSRRASASSTPSAYSAQRNSGS